MARNARDGIHGVKEVVLLDGLSVSSVNSGGGALVDQTVVCRGCRTFIERSLELAAGLETFNADLEELVEREKKRAAARVSTPKRRSVGPCTPWRSQGNHSRASRDLAETGLDIPSRTLSDWTRDKHRQLYEEIKPEAIPEIYSHLADEMESLASYQLHVERKLTEKIEDKIDELPRASWLGASATSPSAAGSASTRPGVSVTRTRTRPAGNGREADRDSGRRATTRQRRDEAGDRAPRVDVPEVPQSRDEDHASRP